MKISVLGVALAGLLLAACNPSTETKPADATPPAGTAATPVVTAPAADAESPADAASAVPSVAGDDAVVNAAIDRVLGDHAKYEAMIKAYQEAVTDGDKAAVAALVSYPLAVNLDGQQTSIPDAMAFVGHYDQIITPAIARVIKAQAYRDLMVNGKGVMFGNGETWVNGICKPESADCSEFDVKVIRIQSGG